MEDKILKILKIKIDAINRNIDNLNYLNGELEKNDDDLHYIEGKIALFDDNDILNFDNISKEDFDNILSMVNPEVAEIFKDKACNYEGIIYIIEGIRKSISLDLTSEQVGAINSFISGMKDKKENIVATISNLSENKDRLPETDLNILMNSLSEYNDIVSKFENHLYLTEIDEINEALDFATTPVSEKSDIFEYILKYNSEIYLANKDDNETVDLKTEVKEEDVPDYEFNTVDVTTNLDTDESVEPELDEHKIDDVKFNLDNFKLDNYETDNQELEENVSEVNNDTNVEVPVPNFEIPVSNLETPETIEIKKDDEPSENNELNTVELEDIIKKIDAKLKEMENEEVENDLEDTKIVETSEIAPVEIPSFENEIPEVENNNVTDMKSMFDKYLLPNMNVFNDQEEVELMLKELSDNNLINLFKNNKNILESMLSSYNHNDLLELITLIKDNLIVKNDEFDYVFSVVVETMPILFTNKEVFGSFKENIKFFKEKNINIINIFDNYRELLIMNNQLMLNNYNKVVSYNIEINSDNVKYMLYNKDVLDNLDYYIEAIGREKGFLGKEEIFDGVKYIKENPYKLNNATRDMLLKLRYTTENNGKLYGNKPGILSGEITNPKVDLINLTPEYLDTFFNGEYEVISKNELKNEIDGIQNIDMTIDENINKLDNSYKIDDLKYKIDNFVLSRIKTIRIYNYLKSKLSVKDALLIGLTYNSVLKKEEYDKVLNVVNQITGGTI